MKYVYQPDIINSKTKGTFYVVRLCLQDENGMIVKKGDPILWLTEEQYKKLLNIN